MPEITVTTFVRHNTDDQLSLKDRNEHEWTAIHVKKIVKGEPLGPTTFFSWQMRTGFRTRIDQSNWGSCAGDLSHRFAARMRADGGDGAIIVPVPNGNATIADDDLFQTLKIARGIASKSEGNLTAFDALRWSEPMGKAHKKERRRDVDQHLDALRVKPGCGKRVILFDDVVTSGSQLCAAKIKLEEAGYDVVGMYAILDVLDEGERGTAPAWREVKRNPMRIADFFAPL